MPDATAIPIYGIPYREGYSMGRNDFLWLTEVCGLRETFFQTFSYFFQEKTLNTASPITHDRSHELNRSHKMSGK